MSFSFDLVAILESNAPGSTSLLPEESKTALSGLSKPSKWAIAAYIMGMAATTLTVIVELFSMLLKRGAAPTLICSLVASISIVGASITVTVMCSSVSAGIRTFLGDVSVHSHLGPHMLAATWLASAFSLGASLLCVLGAYCLCF
ncbi:hypothetical protein BDV29DRAFT_159822 [Aspergillus leporis]|uniref:Uncharacterized protein n=1 Tax=Aspergillus leporis TaxID=41062 RepID=A0A5N5WTP4_9EURO|nr:hypothetical protein BDV29DRAFT_159822 [Aspergillus leporis]